MFHDINKMPEKYLDLTTEKLAKAGITSNPETLSLAEHGLISLTYIVKYPDDVYEKMQCENAPNDDDINDVYKIQNNGVDIINFNLMIFNRLGQLVYSSNNINNSWDGMFKGNKLLPQVFDFYLEMTCYGGKVFFRTFFFKFELISIFNAGK